MSKFGAGYTVGRPSVAASERPNPSYADTAFGRVPPARSASYQPLSQDPGAALPQSATSVSSGRTNPLAVAAFVLAMLLGPFVVPVTLPMAVVARRQITRSGQAGAVLATAAVMISLVYLVLGLTVLALSV